MLIKYLPPLGPFLGTNLDLSNSCTFPLGRGVSPDLLFLNGDSM